MIALISCVAMHTARQSRSEFWLMRTRLNLIGVNKLRTLRDLVSVELQCQLEYDKPVYLVGGVKY